MSESNSSCARAILDKFDNATFKDHMELKVGVDQRVVHDKAMVGSKIDQGRSFLTGG